jgi:hypothetical protein
MNHIDMEGTGPLEDDEDAYLSGMLDTLHAQRYILGVKIRHVTQRLQRSRTAKSKGNSEKLQHSSPRSRSI